MLYRFDGFLWFFGNVKSIQVESIVYGGHYRTIIDDMFSLTSIVTAKEWNIFPKYHTNDNPSIVDSFCEVLSTVITPGCLCSFGVSNFFINFHLFETVFQLLSPTESPYFELYIGGGNLLSKEVAKRIYSTWEKCGAIAVKNINFYDDPLCDKETAILHSFSEFKSYFKF